MERERERDVQGWQLRLLESLRRDVVRDAEEEDVERPHTGLVEVLAFDLAGETFGVSIQRLAEILLPRKVTPLPRTPSFVLGVVSLRGAVLPVIDLARRLGLPPSAPTRLARIVVLRDGQEFMGFRVDQVRGVLRFSREGLETTDFASAVDPRFLEAIGYDRNGTLVAVLSAPNLCDFSLEEV